MKRSQAVSPGLNLVEAPAVEQAGLAQDVQLGQELRLLGLVFGTATDEDKRWVHAALLAIW
jgi:hypothetical protein